MLDGKLPSYYTTAANITYDNSISGLTSTNVQNAIDELATNLPTPGEEPEYTIREIIKNTPGTLSIDEVMGTVINNLGQNSNIELTLPEATEGLSFVVMLGTTSPYRFKFVAHDGDRIFLKMQSSIINGSVGVTSTNRCDSISFNTFKTGDTYDWLAVAIYGDWDVVDLILQ